MFTMTLVLLGFFNTAYAGSSTTYTSADSTYESCFNTTLLRLQRRFENCNNVLQVSPTPDGSSVGAALCVNVEGNYLLIEVPNRYRGKTAAEIDIDPFISEAESKIIERASTRPACIGDNFFVVDITELNL